MAGSFSLLPKGGHLETRKFIKRFQNMFIKNVDKKQGVGTKFKGRLINIMRS